LKQRDCSSRDLYEKLRAMKNPQVPEIYRLAEQEGRLLVVEEYLEGSTLADQLEYAGGALEEKQVLHILQELCTCLKPLHEAHIIHRDIKPANIMLTKDNGVKLIDFGIARLSKGKGRQDTEFLGTKGYAPPEQYGFGETDARSDIYSLGVTLQRCLGKEYRGGLKGIVAGCTALDPADRYGSVEALLADLSRRQKKRKLQKEIGAVLLAFAVLLPAAWWKFQPHAENPLPQEKAMEAGEPAEDVAPQEVKTATTSKPQEAPQNQDIAVPEVVAPAAAQNAMETKQDNSVTSFKYPFLQRSQCSFYLNGAPFEEGIGIPAAIWQNWPGNEEARSFPADWTLALHIDNESAADFVAPRLEVTFDGSASSQNLPTTPSGTDRDITIPLGGRQIPGRLCNLAVRLEDAEGASMYWNFQFYLAR
jgi:serine/threonine protein kinase